MSAAFKPTPTQRALLARLALPGMRLIHHCTKGQHGGLYHFADELATYYQPRTVRPLIESGLITPKQIEKRPMTDDVEKVDHPSHYNSHPSGIECIAVVEHMPFNIGNAVKYLWRCGLKGDEVTDLKKAKWYIEREIQKRESSDAASS